MSGWPNSMQLDVCLLRGFKTVTICRVSTPTIYGILIVWHMKTHSGCDVLMLLFSLMWTPFKDTAYICISALLCVRGPPKAWGFQFHHIWDALLFPIEGHWNFYVTTMLLPVFWKHCALPCVCKLTHFAGNYQAVADCIILLHLTNECKQTEQWDSPVNRPCQGSAFKVCWLS